MAAVRWFALLALVAGCYKTPKAPCAFLCGEGGDCPAGYVCGGDDRCHQLVDGVEAECEPLPGQPDAPQAAQIDAPMSVPDAPLETPDAPMSVPDAPPGTPDAPRVFDAPPPVFDAPEPVFDAPPPVFDAPPPVDAAGADA